MSNNIEVYDHLEECPGVNLSLPTICKSPYCDSMVYFPHHLIRYEITDIGRNFFWLFCSDSCKQDWLEWSLREHGSRLGIIKMAAYDFIGQANQLAVWLANNS